jgi:hypothetical protein
LARSSSSVSFAFGNEHAPHHMSSPIRYWKVAAIAALALVAALILAWSQGLIPRRSGGQPANALLVIAPYRHAGTWVFDDPSAGLVREPFVAGVPEMIDVLVRDIPSATNGFRLLFSETSRVRLTGFGSCSRLRRSQGTRNA